MKRIRNSGRAMVKATTAGMMTAMMVVLMMGILGMGVLGFAGTATAGDGYRATTETLKTLVAEAKKQSNYIKYFCDPTVGGDPDKNRGTDFGKGSNFNDRIRTDMSKNFAARYPGSQLNCLSGGGTWVNGKQTNFIENGIVYKATYNGAWGLVAEYDYPAEGHNEMMVRITDPKGSYIAILADLKNPRNSRFVEAKLPVNMQSSGTVVGADKGFQYTSDELVTAMNLIYTQVQVLPKSTLMTYANALLIDRNERQILINEARKSFGNQKRAEAPRAADTDDE